MGQISLNGSAVANSANAKDVATCLAAVKKFKCTRCVHSGEEPYPPIEVKFPDSVLTESEVTNKMREREKQKREDAKKVRDGTSWDDDAENPSTTTKNGKGLTKLGASKQNDAIAAAAAKKVPASLRSAAAATKITKFTKPGAKSTALLLARSPSAADDVARPLGCFEYIDSPVLNLIFQGLLFSDWRNVARVCRTFAKVCNRYQLMEKVHLTCYHRKVPFEDDILGFGMTPQYYTQRNYQTGATTTAGLQDVEMTLDLLSESAFRIDGVRNGVWKEKFTHFLPVLINGKHATRAWPHIDKALCEMVLKRTYHLNARVEPHMEAEFCRTVFNALSTAMNTLVVAFCKQQTEQSTGSGGSQLLTNAYDFQPREKMAYQSDGTGVIVRAGGLHASERALVGYCALHHILLGYAVRFPLLVKMANQQVQDFITKPATRSKATVPNLGSWMVWLLLAENKSWYDCAIPVLLELFARNVRWNFQAEPLLEAGRELDHTKSGVVCWRLRKTFEASLVGNRLLMFQTFFLRLVRSDTGTGAAGGRLSVAAQYDRYNRSLGQPTAMMIGSLRTAISRFQHVVNYDDFFDTIGVARLPGAELAKLLCAAIDSSLEKRYHKENPNVGYGYNGYATSDGPAYTCRCQRTDHVLVPADAAPVYDMKSSLKATGKVGMCYYDNPLKYRFKLWAITHPKSTQPNPFTPVMRKPPAATAAAVDKNATADEKTAAAAANAESNSAAAAANAVSGGKLQPHPIASASGATDDVSMLDSKSAAAAAAAAAAAVATKRDTTATAATTTDAAGQPVIKQQNVAASNGGGAAAANGSWRRPDSAAGAQPMHDGDGDDTWRKPKGHYVPRGCGGGRGGRGGGRRG